MLELIAGLIIFFVIHSISILNEEWRNRMAERFGEEVWQSAFSLIAITGLGLIVWGYSVARQEPVFLYHPTTQMRYINLALMLAVFPLLIAAYAPGRLRAMVRHPMLLATAVWALAHLLSNGTLADLLLFGSFLIWAFAELISMTYRTPRGAAGIPAPRRRNDIIAIVLGLALYAATLMLTHEWLIGMPVYPW